jgi:tetratricopeptide (TPR) repeat protein
VAKSLELEGAICARRGDRTCALDSQRASVRIRRNLQADPSGLAGALSALGGALRNAGELAEARAAYDEALEVFAASVGPAHVNYGMGLYNRAGVLELMGQSDLAVADYRRSLAIVEKAQGSQHRLLIMVLTGLADSLLRKGDSSAALPVARRAIDIAATNPGEPLMTTLARYALGRALYESGTDRVQGKRAVLDARTQLVGIGAASHYVSTVDRWLAARKIRP